MALKFRRKKCLIALCVVIFSSCVIIYIFADSELEKAGISFSENCNKALPSRFTSELCRNFTNKIAYGKLCEPLCKSNGIIKSRCIHHGDTIVIFAMWNDNEIVLKWKKPHFYNQYLTLDYFNVGSMMLPQPPPASVPDPMRIGQPQQLVLGLLQRNIKHLFHVPQNSNMNLRAVWKDLLLNQLESNLGTAIHGLPSETTNAALRGMGAEFTTDARELRSFVPLLSQDEFSMIGIYQELRHFPKLHGYCGQAYAVERLAPYGDLFPSILRKIDWKKRVKMALSFLDLLQELEHAKSGPLHHCDIQEGNFGLTHDFQVKVIDADMIFTEERVKEILAQSNCSKDSDCDFFDCVSCFKGSLTVPNKTYVDLAARFHCNNSNVLDKTNLDLAARHITL
eukprot:gene19077-20993_t